MKVRNGFVSNSSSSSFMIIGKEISESELEDAVKSGNPVYGVSNQNYHDDGYDYFEIDQDIINAINANNIDTGDIYFYQAISAKVGDDSDSNINVPSTVPKETKCFFYNVRNGHTYDVEDFISHYGNKGE